MIKKVFILRRIIEILSGEIQRRVQELTTLWIGRTAQFKNS